MALDARQFTGMTQADYEYEIVDGIVCIVDQNLGNRSVTNDIENVVEEIRATECFKQKTVIEKLIVTYKDSDGNWDGYDSFTDTFIPLATRDRAVAVQKIKALKK